VPQEKEVTLQAEGKDMYGRTIAMCSYLMALTSTTPSSKTPGAGAVVSEVCAGGIGHPPQRLVPSRRSACRREGT